MKYLILISSQRKTFNQAIIFQIVFIFSFLFIFSDASSDKCSLGCKHCSNQSTQTESICNYCESDFQLLNNRCKYLKCSQNTYLQITPETNQQDGKIEIIEDCKAICENKYYENSDLNVCDNQEQCSVSYSRSTDQSINVGVIESLYMINSMYSMIVYPTYITIINTHTGQYLRDIITSTTLSTLFFKNFLIIFSTNNQIIEWIFEKNFQRIITKINMGKLTKKSQFFDLGENLQAVSSYDDTQSIIYFTRIYLDESDSSSIQENTPSFSFVGCALKIVENFVICFGKDYQIQIKLLSLKNNCLVLEDQIQLSSCQNYIFYSNSIIQSTLIKQNKIYSIFFIQSLNTQLIVLIYDSIRMKFDCKFQDLLEQPQKIRLIDQQNLQFLFAIQFVSKIIFYNQEFSERFHLLINSVTDIAFVRDQSVSVLTTYKMLVMINAQNIIQTYTVDVQSKKIIELSTYLYQIKNSLQFLTYNDKNIQKDQIETISTENYNLFIANDKLQSVNAITDKTNYIVTPYQQPNIGHSDSINEMVYIDDSQILITCSSDGNVKAWNTLNGYSPFHLYSVKQNSESCRSVLVHQNKWVVALYTRSILIFSLKNQFIRYSYQFQGLISDQMQFISQITSNILLFYDYQFILLKGSDLSEIKRSTPDSNITVISLYFIENFNIIIQSGTNLLETYQFDPNNNYQFKKITNMNYQSSYGNFSTISIDLLSQTDFEILLGCKDNSMVILNNQLSQVFFIKITQGTQGYPTLIQKHKNSNTYILFAYCTEPNTVYLFFIYQVNRNTKQGLLVTRNYSLKHNQGLRPLQNFKNQEMINFQITMPFAYFTIIVNCVYNPIEQTPRYGHFIYSIGKPITKYSIRDNGQIQYYGSSDGILSIGTTDFSIFKRLTLNQSTTDNPIKKITVNAFLKSLFVIQTQIDIYSLFTHNFLSQIKFDSQFDNQQVQGILISEKNYIVIAYKNQQLIVRNLIDNSDKNISTISMINGVLLDEKSKIFYIYGSSLQIFNFDLKLVTIITEEGQLFYQQCLLTANLLICKSNTNSLIIYSRKTYSLLSSNLIKNQPNMFKIYIDEVYSQIYVVTTFIQVFNFSGILLSEIQNISQNILDIQIFGSHLCVLSSACKLLIILLNSSLEHSKNFNPIIKVYYILLQLITQILLQNIFDTLINTKRNIQTKDFIKKFLQKLKLFRQKHSFFFLLNKMCQWILLKNIFVFSRNNLTFIKQFKPTGGGNILGYYYIQDYNLIVYYADEIRFGQLFYFSLNNYLDDGYTLSAYNEMGIGRVVSLFYDSFTSRLNYFDSLGNLNSITFLAQRSFYNALKFEDFQVLGSPTDYEVDYVFNMFYIYNKSIIIPINYNTIPKYVIKQNRKEDKLYFKYLPSNATSKTDSQYFIFDSNNILYSYKDFSQIYQTHFTNPVINVKQLDQHEIVLFIFENEMLLFTYQQIFSEKIISQNYIAKISDPKISVFLTNELIFTTEQKLIHINYQFFKDGKNDWKKQIIDFSEYNESIRNYIKYGTQYHEKVLISFNSGRVYFYDTYKMEYKEIRPVWTPQEGLATNFVKYFILSDSYVVLGYNYNILVVLSIFSFVEVKSIDITNITQQQSSPLNFLSIDELNNRIFYSLMFSKLIYVLKIKTLELEQYLSFPNDEYNRLTITSQYIFTYSIFQINIFKRDTLQFVNKIKKSSQDHRIITVTILEENKIIIAMNLLLEVYLFNILDQSITLIDSSSLNNPEIIDAYMINDDSNILRIVGISDSSIFDKRFNIRMYTSPLTNNQSTGVIKYFCYSELNMQDRIQGENLFQSIYNMNNKNINYRIVTTFGQDLKSLDFIPDSSIKVIIKSDNSNTNRILNLQYNSFSLLKRTLISLKDFSLKLNDQTQKYIFSSLTKNVEWQNIKIEMQQLKDVQVVFSGMSKVIISQLTISQIDFNLEDDDSDTIKKWDQSFLLFVDCDIIIIDKLIINYLKMQKKSVLLRFQRVNSVQIQNLSIQNSSFYQLIALEKIQSFSMDTLKVNNNLNKDRIPNGSQFLQSLDYQLDKSEIFIVSIIGCISSIINNVSMSQNTNILFLKYLNSYSNDNQKVIIYNDSLVIQNSFIQDTIINTDSQIPLSKQINSPLVYIEASNIQFKNLNYFRNQGNIQIQNSGKIKILDSQFEQNISLEGGSIYFNLITKSIDIIRTNFTKNIAKGGGGALLVKDIVSITFDDKSIVTKNKAQIGGGIRVINSNIDPFSVLKGKQIFFDNTAYIFGKNVGIYPTQVNIYLNQSHLRLLNQESQTPVQGINHDDIFFNKKNSMGVKSNQSDKFEDEYSNIIRDKQFKQERILNELIKFNGVNSGDQFPLSIQLQDEEGLIVSYSLENLKDQKYTSAIIDEIKSFSFEVQVEDDSNTSLIGQTFINFNQFDMERKEFQFMNLKVNAKPNQTRSIKLISSTNSFIQSNQIKQYLYLNFRSCQRGEIFKYITSEIVICETCQIGFYSLIDPVDYNGSQDSITCLKCPANVEKCEKDKIVLMDGYWRESNDSSEIYECNKERYIQSCKESDSQSKKCCIKGYSGPICERCDEIGDVWGDRYTYVEKDQYCVQCDQDRVYYIFYILASLGLIVYLTINIIMFMNNFTYHSITSYLRYMNIIPISASCIRDQSTEYIKSLNNYFQISSILLRFNLKSPITQVVNFSNYAGSPATKVLSDAHCIFTESMIQTYGVTKIKIILQGVYPLTFLILICLIFTILTKKKLFGIKYYHNYATTIILYTQFQPELIKYFTDALSCIQIGDKKYALLNLLIICDDPSYNIFKISFIIPYLSFLMIIPLFILFQIHKNRNKLNYCINSYKFGYFYLGYKSKYYFWEFIRIYLRTLMVIFYTLQKEINLSFSYQIVSFILSVNLLLIYIFKPYKQKQVFQLETISICVLLINIGLQYIDIIYPNDVLKIVEYSLHITYVLLVVTIILILKLRMRKDRISLCIMNAFKYCLPEKIFNRSIKNRRIQLITFKRWVNLRRNLNVIIKNQVEKIQQKNEFSLSKQQTMPKLQTFRLNLKNETDTQLNSRCNLKDNVKKPIQLTKKDQNTNYEFSKRNQSRKYSGKTDYSNLNSEQSPKLVNNINKENDKENTIYSHDLDDKYTYEGQSQSPQYQKTAKSYQSQIGDFFLDKVTEGDQENIILSHNLDKNSENEGCSQYTKYFTSKLPQKN